MTRGEFTVLNLTDPATLSKRANSYEPCEFHAAIPLALYRPGNAPFQALGLVDEKG